MHLCVWCVWGRGGVPDIGTPHHPHQGGFGTHVSFYGLKLTRCVVARPATLHVANADANAYAFLLFFFSTMFTDADAKRGPDADAKRGLVRATHTKDGIVTTLKATAMESKR